MVFKLLKINLKNQERSKTKKDWPRKHKKSDGKFLRVSFFERSEEVQQEPGSTVDPFTIQRKSIRNGLCGRGAAMNPLFWKGNGGNAEIC